MQLQRHQDAIRNFGANVLIITFSEESLIRKWVNETAVSFSILIDREQVAYKAFQLNRSFLRSWSPKVWLAYVRLMLKGHRWRGIQGDSAQLGGDFLIDRQGKILFTWRSNDPDDRPSPENLMELMSSHHQKLTGM